MTDQYLKDLCEQNRDPETKILKSLESFVMWGKKPRGFKGTTKEFYESFFTPEMTPNMGIIHGDQYGLYFTNRTAYPVVPTDVSQIEYARQQIIKTYPRQVYGVEEVDVEADNIDEIPTEKFDTASRLNPKDDCFAIYGSKPGDYFFIQGDQNNEWITGKQELLTIGSPMPISEKRGTEGTCVFITPKDYCPNKFYYRAMKLAYNKNSFMKQVICEPDQDKFIHFFEEIVNSSQENDLIILDDFQEVLERISFSHLGIILHNTSGKGSVLFADKDGRMLKSYDEIFQLQEFAVTKSFQEKFQQAFCELNDWY